MAAYDVERLADVPQWEVRRDQSGYTVLLEPYRMPHGWAAHAPTLAKAIDLAMHDRAVRP